MPDSDSKNSQILPSGSESLCIPFLKWAGGKRWLVRGYADIFPEQYKRYFEPFLGAGSVYFYLRPANAVLTDINAELISAYLGIRADWQKIQSSLLYRQRAHKEDPNYYYRQRARSPVNALEQAARLIYLNRTCFNGIYRVNRSGQFNVPKGTKDRVVMDSDDFEAMSKLLLSADIRVSDFEQTIDEATDGDLVFADPPYTVLHNYNGFIKYNEVIFSWKDQERLAKALERALKRNVKIVSTNANHESVRQLYTSHGFFTKSVSRASSISADIMNRRKYEELIIFGNL
jgi:DNA adenine methylase